MTSLSPARVSTTPAGRLFHLIATSTALAVGALQMYHVRGGFLTNYGADIFGTAWFYILTRQGRVFLLRRHPMGAGVAALVVFGLCALSELGQKWHLMPGHFDPWDLLAYAVTLLVCWQVDRRVPLAILQ